MDEFEIAHGDHEPRSLLTTEALRDGGEEKKFFLSVPRCLRGENGFMKVGAALDGLRT